MSKIFAVLLPCREDEPYSGKHPGKAMLFSWIHYIAAQPQYQAHDHVQFFEFLHDAKNHIIAGAESLRKAVILELSVNNKKQITAVEKLYKLSDSDFDEVVVDRDTFKVSYRVYHATAPTWDETNVNGYNLWWMSLSALNEQYQTTLKDVLPVVQPVLTKPGGS